MNGLSQAQRIYDRRLPEDGKPSVENEYAAPEFAPADAIRCNSTEEALAVEKRFPGCAVVIVGKPLIVKI